MDGSYPTLSLNAVQAGLVPVGVDSVDGRVHLPSGEDFLRADFARSGPDLLIETPSGGHYVLPGYFMAEQIPSLETFDGAVLSPKLVSALAGPAAPGMVAQAAAPGDAAGSGASIGQVSEVAGGVTVRHVDGSQSTLAVGAPIFQGDVLETAQASHVGIIFVDDTVFSLDEGGRMVIDEMVFDPGAQTGVFNAQVVQGVFSFVSGQVAKTSPDGMVVSTPTATIGIRGTTGAGNAAAEGQQNSISLLPDPDGNVGEMTVSNSAGVQVLNQPGATTTIISAFQPPPPPVVLPSAQIQQQYGTTLTKLTQVVAQKATVDAARAQAKAQQAEEEAQQAEIEAQQAQDEAQQADEGAQAADAEAEAAQAEAEAAQAAAETAKAEAEAKGDPESLAQAQAAEAKAAEAQAKAQLAGEKAQTEAAKAVEVKTAAEAKMADFAAKTAEVFQAQAQVQKAVEFTAVAKTAAEVQGKVFQEFVQSGLITLPPGMSVADVMSAGQQYGAQMAGQAGLAGTVGPGDGPGFGPGEGPDGGPGFGPEGRPDFGPEGGLSLGAFMDDGGGMTGGLYGGGMTGGLYGGGMMGGLYGGDMMGGLYGGGMMDVYGMGSLDLLNFFSPNDLYNLFVTYDLADVVSYYTEPGDDSVTTVFSEFLIAGNAGETLTGLALDTNFYFQWRDNNGVRHIHGAYTVTDVGGTDQLSLDNLDDALLKVTMSSGTSGDISLWEGYTSSEGATAAATVAFSNIDQSMLSDLPVAAFADINFLTDESKGGDVIVLPSMNATEVGYVIAGTVNADPITIGQPSKGAIVFGKEGGDTFNFTTTAAKKVVAIGGTTGTDNVDDGSNGGIQNDGIPDDHINTFSYSQMTSYSAGSAGIFARLGQFNALADPNDAEVTDDATKLLFGHELWDVGAFIGSPGNDTIYIYSSTFASVSGGGGVDTIIGVSGASGVDVFKYAATADGGNTGTGDTIQYFTSGVDKFAFVSSAFGNIAVGALASTSFVSGSAALDGDDFFFYDAASARLYYDSDGSGTNASAVAIATLLNNTGDVQASDITIV